MREKSTEPERWQAQRRRDSPEALWGLVPHFVYGDTGLRDGGPENAWWNPHVHDGWRWPPSRSNAQGNERRGAPSRPVTFIPMLADTTRPTYDSALR